VTSTATAATDVEGVLEDRAATWPTQPLVGQIELENMTFVEAQHALARRYPRSRFALMMARHHGFVLPEVAPSTSQTPSAGDLALAQLNATAAAATTEAAVRAHVRP